MIKVVVHRDSGSRQLVSVYQDGRLVVGNVMWRFPARPTTADLEARAAQVVAAMADPGPAAEESPIDEQLRAAKERLKTQAIAWLRQHPAGSLDAFLAAIDWADQGLALAILRAYANQAVADGYAPAATPLDTPEACFAVVRDVVLALTDEQLSMIAG